MHAFHKRSSGVAPGAVAPAARWSAPPRCEIIARVDPAPPPAPRGPARALDPGLLLVSVVALGVVAAQLALRSLDDSRLTSWAWVFDGRDPLALFALVAAALAAAHLAARAPIPPRARAPALVALSFAAGAGFWTAPELIVDASRYFTQAKYLELHGLRAFLSEWGREIPAWTDLPLVPALYGLAFRALGEDRLHVQALTTALFAGSVALTWRTGAALFDEGVGLAGGAFLLAIPYLLTQVPAMLVDVPTMFFVTLATWASVRAVQRGGAPRIALAAAAVFLAFASKYSAWLLLSGLPALALVERRRSPGAPRRAATVAALSALLVGAWLLLHREVVAEQLALLLSYQAPGLRRWGESFRATFLFQVHPFLTAGALLSVWMAVRRRDPRWLVVAWPVLLLAALQVRRIRYWLPAFPMLALMAAYGLHSIRSAPARRLVVASAVASSLVVALWGMLPFLQRTSAANLRDAGAYLDRLAEPTAEVLTPRRDGATVNPAVSVPLLDLFTAKPLRHAYEAPSPEAARAARESPLRFTWEYRNPRHYARRAEDGPAAVVVITDDLDAPLPADLRRRLDGLRLARTFARDEGVFAHRTLVRVYRDAGAAGDAGR